MPQCPYVTLDNFLFDTICCGVYKNIYVMMMNKYEQISQGMKEVMQILRWTTDKTN